jgi:hypothetical protein
LLVLVGIGLLLAAPLGVTWTRWGPLSADHAAVTNISQDCLRAIEARDENAFTDLLPPTLVRDLSQMPLRPFDLLPYTLRVQGITFQRGDIKIDDSEAQVHFTARYPDYVATALSQGKKNQSENQPLILPSVQGQPAEQRGILSLRKVDGQWRVRGLKISMTPALSLSMGDTDFEQTVAAWMRIARPDEREVQLYQALTQIDIQQFAPSWQRNLDEQNKPAREVLQLLTNELGLKWYPTVNPLEELNKSVSVKMQDWSRLEAIEEVCRRADLHVEYSPNGVTWRKGTRSLPVAFTGPFRVEVKQLQEFPSYATGSLKLGYSAVGLPELVARLLREEREVLRIEEVTAADGRDLYHADYQLPSYQRDPVTVQEQGKAIQINGETHVPLRHLLRNVDAIHRLRGWIRVVIPIKVDEILFDKLDPGVTRQAGEVKLTLRNITRVTSPRPETSPGFTFTQLEFDGEGIDGRRLRWLVHDRVDKPLRAVMRLGESKPVQPGPLQFVMPGESFDPSKPVRSGPLRFAVLGEPKAMRFKFFVIREEKYRFELRDIPLEGRAPWSLEPAQFPGHAAPVTIEVRQFNRSADTQQRSPGSFEKRISTIQVQARNHSQKDVEKVQIKILYLDKTGKTLKEAVFSEARPSYLGSSYDNRRYAILIKSKDQAVVLSLTEKDMPEGTEKIEATVTRVDFADTTFWSP